MPTGNEYSVADYFGTISTLVQNATEKINKALNEATGVDPKYDLVNRGNMVDKRMSDDNGMDLREVPKMDPNEIRNTDNGRNHA